MDLHPLDGAFERVKRAEEHLAALRPLIDAVRQRHEQLVLGAARVVLAQLDANNPPKVQVVMRVPILLGEICYNLRNALDYLVFELARHDFGAPQKDTQFPITKTADSFRAQRAKRLKGINDHHAGMIERLQPYNGCQWTGALGEISNRDKHREFVAMRCVSAGLAYVSTDPEYGNLTLPTLRVQHPTHGEMDVKADLSYTVHFADGPPVMDTLEIIKTKVFETLTEFRAEIR